MSDRVPPPARPARLALLLLSAVLGGCASTTTGGSSLQTPPPYRLYEVDRSMSCEAIAASFHDAAMRAARIQYWLAAGSLPGYGLDRFPVDAPAQLEDERGRLDALSDLQRFKGCPVQSPVAAVAAELARFPPLRSRPAAPASGPVVLRRLG